MSPLQPALTRVQIREIFQRHKGAVKTVSERANVKHSVVSGWLRGRVTSKNVASAAALHAAELLEQEQKANAA